MQFPKIGQLVLLRSGIKISYQAMLGSQSHLYHDTDTLKFFCLLIPPATFLCRSRLVKSYGAEWTFSNKLKMVIDGISICNLFPFYTLCLIHLIARESSLKYLQLGYCSNIVIYLPRVFTKSVSKTK